LTSTFECCPNRLICNNWDKVFNAAFNNISVTLEETGVQHKTTELQQFTDKLYHNVVSSTSRHERDSNSQLKWWYALITQVVVNQPGIGSRRTLQNFEKMHELFKKRYQQLLFHLKCKIINKQFAHSMFLIFLVFCVVFCFCFVCPHPVSCVSSVHSWLHFRFL
jgi:hypothetical protein